MSNRKLLLVGLAVVLLMMTLHTLGTLGKPAFAPGDRVIDMKTGHHGVVARYHRWPYRHYVVVVNDIPTEVRPEFVRADD